VYYSEHLRYSVVCPIIDIIDSDTFKYVESPVCRGGFTWGMFFKWDYPPWSYFKTPEDYIKPLRSATMAGGLFAISKEYFEYLGEYDKGMDVWGAENVELSFRVSLVVLLPHLLLQYQYEHDCSGFVRKSENL
jgi:polypeptide N-acetylgalactosaminyltransferase